MELRPSLGIDMKSVPPEGEAILQISDKTLVRKLIFHLKGHHFLDVEFIRLACILEELISEVISVDVMELSKLHNVPRTRFHIQGTEVPSPRCGVTEDIMKELYERGLGFITMGQVCGGVNISSGASLVYPNIIDGEINKYLNLTPRCQLHQIPCGACGSLATF